MVDVEGTKASGAPCGWSGPSVNHPCSPSPSLPPRPSLHRIRGHVPACALTLSPARLDQVLRVVMPFVASPLGAISPAASAPRASAPAGGTTPAAASAAGAGAAVAGPVEVVLPESVRLAERGDGRKGRLGRMHLGKPSQVAGLVDRCTRRGMCTRACERDRERGNTAESHTLRVATFPPDLARNSLPRSASMSTSPSLSASSLSCCAAGAPPPHPPPLPQRLLGQRQAPRRRRRLWCSLRTTRRTL